MFDDFFSGGDGGDIFSSVQSAVSDISSGINDVMSEVNYAVGQVNNVMDNINYAVSSVENGIYDAVNGVSNAVYGIESGIYNAVNNIGNTFDSFSNTFDNFGNSFENFGDSFGSFGDSFGGSSYPVTSFGSIFSNSLDINPGTTSQPWEAGLSNIFANNPYANTSQPWEAGLSNIFKNNPYANGGTLSANSLESLSSGESFVNGGSSSTGDPWSSLGNIFANNPYAQSNTGFGGATGSLSSAVGDIWSNAGNLFQNNPMISGGGIGGGNAWGNIFANNSATGSSTPANVDFNLLSNFASSFANLDVSFGQSKDYASSNMAASISSAAKLLEGLSKTAGAVSNASAMSYGTSTDAFNPAQEARTSSSGLSSMSATSPTSTSNGESMITDMQQQGNSSQYVRATWSDGSSGGSGGSGASPGMNQSTTSGDYWVVTLRCMVPYGFIAFPITPNIQTTDTAKYSTAPLVHSNYASQFYESSEVSNITISAEFPVQNAAEGHALTGAISLLRAVTKMFWAGDPLAGTPPPLVFLNGYGGYFSDVPCVVVNFTHTMPEDKDYILCGKNRVPTLSTLQITLQPVYSRNQLITFSPLNIASGHGGPFI